MRVKLIQVLGDQEEFADLIGAVGELRETRSDGLCFSPERRGDFLSMAVKEMVEENDVVNVKTGLGNTFSFRKLN